MTLSSTMRTLMGGTVPSRSPADAGFGGGAGSPFADRVVAVAAAGLLGFLDRRGLCWPGWGDDARFGGVTEVLCWSRCDWEGGVGRGATGAALMPLIWDFGSVVSISVSMVPKFAGLLRRPSWL